MAETEVRSKWGHADVSSVQFPTTSRRGTGQAGLRSRQNRYRLSQLTERKDDGERFLDLAFKDGK